MVGKFLWNIWGFFNRDIELNLLEIVKGGVEFVKVVFEVVNKLKEGKDIQELKFFIEKIDFVLDVLSFLLGSVVGVGLFFLFIVIGIIFYIVK